jgi:hypothetical protein
MASDSQLTLSEEQLDRLAHLLAVKLAASKAPAPSMMTVEDVCKTFQVSRAWVYENAGRLGGFKLGPGERAPLRFDPKRVSAALQPLGDPLSSEPHTKPVPTAGRRRPKRLHPVYDG